MTWLLVVFLAVHGLLHLAIWTPPPPPPDEHRAPFSPDHSALLTASEVPQVTAHRWAVGLAVATATAYVLGAGSLAVGASWAAAVVTVAAGLGLVLKTVYFHPWLLLGLALDALVLTTALRDWPIDWPTTLT